MRAHPLLFLIMQIWEFRQRKVKIVLRKELHFKISRGLYCRRDKETSAKFLNAVINYYLKLMPSIIKRKFLMVMVMLKYISWMQFQKRMLV